MTTKNRLANVQQIKTAMLVKLKESVIVGTDVTKLKFKPLTASQVTSLGFPQAAAFKIPYFDINGKLLKFYRVRYLEDLHVKGFAAQTVNKPLRYIQPANTVNPAYFTPYYIDWPSVVKDTQVSLVITEGELKAASACILGVPTIGLGGVWNFRATQKKIDLIADLKNIKWKDRKVYIAYDSDSVTNPLVLMAEKFLALELTNLGAKVFITRIPPSKKLKKVGLDDYIAAHSKKDVLRLFSDQYTYDFDQGQALHEFNEEIVYIRDPGLIVENKTLLKMTPAAFTSHAYANRFYTEYSLDAKGNLSAKQKQTAIAWLTWPYRAELERLTYRPGHGRVVDNELNTWLGWSVDSVKGNIQPWKQLLDHIFGDDKDARRWFEQWCAYPVQFPGTKLFTAVVIWGLVEGTMKTALGHTLMRLYGQNAIEIHDTQLRDDRNEWADSKQFVLADDITGHTNRELANRLKTLITQKYIRLDKKYIPSYSIPDCINYFFTSNDVDAFFLTGRDRRYFVHEVRAGKPDATWVNKYIEWRDDDDSGIAALRYHLEHLDLTGFNPRAEAFSTNSKQQMVQMGRSDLNDWVHSLGFHGELYINGIQQDGDLWTSQELLRAYDPDNKTGVKINGMARELSRAGFRQLKQVRLTAGGMVRLFALRNIEKWERASTKIIISHYEATCPELKAKSQPEKKRRYKK